MGLYGVVLGSLAVWRISHLITAEGGPWRMFERLREALGVGFWGELVHCIYCASLWVSAPLAVWLGGDLREQMLLWPALSAGALVIERVTSRGELPAAYIEE